MAKQKKQKGRQPQSSGREINRSTLPQNIINVGERVEENKNIYILQSVYKQVHKFTADKTVNEAGGMLVGYIIEEFGKTNIIIDGFVEAKHCEATPTTLTFTHSTWDACHKEIEKKFPKEKILGWIHTHPNYGIFLSEYDIFIQQNFFANDYQVAYVVDPIQNIEGFYFWINGKVERCKGFYVFDKNGKKIDAVKKTAESVSEEKTSSGSLVKPLITGVLCALIIILIALNVSLRGSVEDLEKRTAILENELIQLVEYLKITGMQVVEVPEENPYQEMPTENNTEVQEEVESYE